ncbi:MAG TPA: methyl-accepting chemotaxis protein [Tepidisphaeraceae bacterium]|nr:methyl-accepting chemotaxis protein [Tepidisphaeraceae bacterium]
MNNSSSHSDSAGNTTSDWIIRAADVCQAAARGDLEGRLLRIEEAGDAERLMHSINHLLDLTDAFVREATATLEHASQGKFFRRVLKTGMLGTFGRACESINQATAHMGEEHERLAAAEEDRARLSADFQAAIAAVDNLEKATQKVIEGVKAIQSISGKTNLLALNSAIEAARVGQAGRGFAVVAGEVKLLADQTAKTSDRIQGQIEAIGSAARTAGSQIRGIWQRLQKTDSARDEAA